MASVKGPAPLYEVWVDEERFIASFVYPASKEQSPKVAPGAYRLASHCHYRIGAFGVDVVNRLLVLPAVPHGWSSYAAPYTVCLQIAREFSGAHVMWFDGVERRDVRMRDPYARHSARNG